MMFVLSIHDCYIQRLFSYRDWWSLFNQSIYQLGLDVMEMHIFLFGILLLLAVDLIRYAKGESIADFLEKQWIVFRWGILLVLLFTCVVFGCYGPGFNSAQFIYFHF